MKSLVLKDLYNIGHNAKQMLIILVFLAVCFIPSSGAAAFIVTSTIICSMMTITTFSFDERSNWEKYALIMPVTRKEYIQGKYAVSIIFSLVGILIGIISALALSIVKGPFEATAILGCTIVGVFIAIFYVSLIIPLMIKFGTESARMIMIGTIMVPALISFGLYKLAVYMGIQFTDNLILMLMGVAVILLILLAVISYHLSVKWFEKKEF